MIRKILLMETPISRPNNFDAKKKRISVVPPLGLAYIAAVLEQEGFEVKIIDCLIEGSLEGTRYGENKIRYGLTDEEIKEKIIEFSPDLVDISCLFTEKEFDMFNLCRIANETNPRIITITGGSHPTLTYDKVLKSENLDYVLLGEAEYSTLELIRTLNDNGNLSQIDGIAYKENSVVKVNPKTKYIENLDELPLPARYLLNMENT